MTGIFHGPLPFRWAFHCCRLGAATSSVGRAHGLTLTAHQRHGRFCRCWIPSLLAVDGHAVLQVCLSLVVALEMDLIRGMVRVAVDSEVRELIGPLRRDFGCFACRGIQGGLRTAKGHRIQIAQAVICRSTARDRSRCVAAAWAQSVRQRPSSAGQDRTGRLCC